MCNVFHRKQVVLYVYSTKIDTQPKATDIIQSWAEYVFFNLLILILIFLNHGLKSEIYIKI